MYVCFVGIEVCVFWWFDRNLFLSSFLYKVLAEKGYGSTKVLLCLPWLLKTSLPLQIFKRKRVFKLCRERERERERELWMRNTCYVCWRWSEEINISGVGQHENEWTDRSFKWYQAHRILFIAKRFSSFSYNNHLLIVIIKLIKCLVYPSPFHLHHLSSSFLKLRTTSYVIISSVVYHVSFYL